MIKAAPKEDPNVKRDMDLPPLMQKRNMDPNLYSADLDIMKEASADILKKNNPDKHYDPYADFDNDPFKVDDTEKLSMRQLMQQKLKTMENVEAVDDRKTRLKAQRDLLVKKKQEVREKELEAARKGESDNMYSNNLFNDLLALDKKVNAKEKSKKSEAVKKQPQEVLQVDDFDDFDDKPKAQPKQVKKDMKSLFDDSDEDIELKKDIELKARQQRQKNILKQLIHEES